MPKSLWESIEKAAKLAGSDPLIAYVAGWSHGVFYQIANQAAAEKELLENVKSLLARHRRMWVDLVILAAIVGFLIGRSTA